MVEECATQIADLTNLAPSEELSPSCEDSLVFFLTWWLQRHVLTLLRVPANALPKLSRFQVNANAVKLTRKH